MLPLAADVCRELHGLSTESSETIGPYPAEHPIAPAVIMVDVGRRPLLGRQSVMQLQQHLTLLEEGSITASLVSDVVPSEFWSTVRALACGETDEPVLTQLHLRDAVMKWELRSPRVGALESFWIDRRWLLPLALEVLTAAKA